MAPTNPIRPVDMFKVDRGRPLTRQEADELLAENQTPIRHGQAEPSYEVAEMYRDWLVEYERQTVTQKLEAIAKDLLRSNEHELRRAGAVTEAALTLVEIWAARAV